MKDSGDLHEVLERGEDAMLQQIIDQVEGKLGQEELGAQTQHPQHPTKEEYAQWKKRLDKLSDVRRKQCINNGWLRHTAFAAAVLILLFSLTAAAVKLQLFTEVSRGQFTQIQLNDLAETRISEWTDVYLPVNLPEGFYVSDTFESGDAKMIEYANSEGIRIIFYEYGPGSGIRLDSEDADKQPYQISGQDAWLLQKNSRCTLYWYWNDGTRICSLEYPIEAVSEKEIINMAESLVYQSK